MKNTAKHLKNLTAAELMTPNPLLLPEGMPLRDAACLLWDHQVGGAPVVDAHGVCVGVLSSMDFLRHAGKQAAVPRPAAEPRVVTCSFQTKHRRADGQEVTLCTLPPGVCPVQVKQVEPGGQELLVCSEPHCVLVDWQIVHLEKLSTNEVRGFMTPDPVTVKPGASIRTLARMMIDAHIHRVIVVDEDRKPVGIVSSTDLLAVIAYADDEP